MILVLGKARSLTAPKLVCRGLSHLGDLIFCQKTAQDVMHERAHCHDEAANHQLPSESSERFLWRNECSSLMQNLMNIHCSTHSVILNVMATQYTTCSFNGVYHPNWLVQWSRHCSHTHIPVHSPRLPGYNDVAQTILVKLTMVGLFTDLPHTYMNPYTWAHYI